MHRVYDFVACLLLCCCFLFDAAARKKISSLALAPDVALPEEDDESDATVNSSDSEMIDDYASDVTTSVVESDCEVVEGDSRVTRSAVDALEKGDGLLVRRSRRVKRTIDLSADDSVDENAPLLPKRRKVCGSKIVDQTRHSNEDEKDDIVVTKPGKREVSDTELEAPNESNQREPRSAEMRGADTKRRYSRRWCLSRSRSQSADSDDATSDPEHGFLATVEAIENDNDDWDPEQDDVFSRRRRRRRKRRALMMMRRESKHRRRQYDSNKENRRPQGHRARRTVVAPSRLQDFVTGKIDALLGMLPKKGKGGARSSAKKTHVEKGNPEQNNVCTFSSFNRPLPQNGVRPTRTNQRKSPNKEQRKGRRVSRACVPCHKAKTMCSEGTFSDLVLCCVLATTEEVSRFSILAFVFERFFELLRF